MNIDELLSTDSLPAPARRTGAPKEPEAVEPVTLPRPAMRQVGIADQIAIRSYVLGKGLGKTSKYSAEHHLLVKKLKGFYS